MYYSIDLRICVKFHTRWVDYRKRLYITLVSTLNWDSNCPPLPACGRQGGGGHSHNLFWEGTEVDSK